MRISLPCYRCGDRECVGELYDWCICEPCDMRKKYNALFNQYIDLTRQERWDEALEVHKELDTMYESIQTKVFKEVRT